MTSIHKRTAERRHRIVCRKLAKLLPGCDIKYNGEYGIDLTVFYKGKSTFIEIKTCEKIIMNGLKPRLGMFHFKQAQHDDLIAKDGWYAFYVGGLMFACPHFFIDANKQHVSVRWCDVLIDCPDDWLEWLRKDIYTK